MSELSALPADERPLVLHIITGLGTGGAEMMLLKLTSQARAYRHRVVSLGGEGTIGPRLRAAGIPVHALKVNSPMGLLRAPFALRRILQTYCPALVQGWMTHGNLAASWAVASARPRVPLAWNVRQSIVDFRYEKWTTALLIKLSAICARFADVILYNSSAGVRDHESLGYPSSLRHLIPNGFDTQIFAPSASRRAQMREQLGVEKETILIGLVARVHPMKNHQGFLAAADQLLAATDSDVRFLLAGLGAEASNAAMRALLPTTRLAERTLLLGDRKDVADINAALDIAVNASVHGEGFPNAVGEAMATAVPCVVTDVGDNRWIVGDSGFVVPSGDVAALAAALQKMAEMTESQRRMLGMAARKRVEQEFSLASIAARYEQLYAELIGRRGAPN